MLVIIPIMKNRGVTLIEVLITAIISSFILIGSSIYITQTYAMNDKIVLENNAFQALNYVYSNLEKDIKNSCNIFVADQTGYQELIILGKDNSITAEYRLYDNGKFTDENGIELVKFTDADFSGTFTPVSSTLLKYNLKVTINYQNKTYETDSLNYYIKCRNTKVAIGI